MTMTKQPLHIKLDRLVDSVFKGRFEPLEILVRILLIPVWIIVCWIDLRKK